jgi:4-diphosphocytidyl-2-C-methyl-D-erythritol kinase
MGAGLGGGSSNAVAALRALRDVSGVTVSAEEMMRMAAELGSDCPLFLADGPVVMRGRGERVEILSAAAAARLRVRRVLVFKPAFGIATAWAYGRLAECVRRGELAYDDAAEEEARLQAWLADKRAPVEALARNTFERVAFAKFVALPVMLAELRAKFGVAAWMSGSGSACFALLPAGVDAAAMIATIREGWGESAWVVETTLG